MKMFLSGFFFKFVPYLVKVEYCSLSGIIYKLLSLWEKKSSSDLKHLNLKKKSLPTNIPIILYQNSDSATLIFLIFFQLYLFFGKKSHIFTLFVHTVTGDLFTFGIQSHPLNFECLESCTFKKCHIFVMLMQFL